MKLSRVRSVILPAILLAILPRVFPAIASAALGVILVGATGARAGDPAPVPAPGQQVPAHAAGGWPTDTTGDDKKPARTAEQQAALDSVAGELKRLANECGPDSVILQAKFLIRSMAAGAIGPTEVRVAGPSSTASDHLEIDVETGLYFDEDATTAETRRDTVWKDVASPVLDEMVSFKIQPSSLDLVFLFDVQQKAADGSLSPTQDARHEAFHVRIDSKVLDEIAADRLNGDAVRERAVLTPASVVVRPGADPVP